MGLQPCGPDEAAPADLVELGVVRGAYGLKGWVRIALLAADGAVLEATADWWLQSNGRWQLVAGADRRRHGSAILAKWPDCESKEAADALKGAAVAVARGQFPALPEGQHYLADLLGSVVVNRQGETLGEVGGLRANEAAGELRQWLEVNDQGATRLIPLVESYVDEVDAAHRVVRVDWQKDW